MDKQYNIGLIGIGIVGNAIYESLKSKNINVYGYDKYKNGGIGTFSKVIDNDMLFLCLPTPFDSSIKQYDKSCIFEVCKQLVDISYNGIVLIKSTIEIGTMNYLNNTYPLKYIHNPEFLSMKTAIYDVNNQVQIVLGVGSTIKDIDINFVKLFYETYYCNTPISICSYKESECMKIACNSFYAVKVQFFNEIYALCGAVDISYNTVRDLMVGNGWMLEQHTHVPGSDGKLSYGHLCLPKDSNSLNEQMKRLNTPHAVLEATIKERNVMRDDHDNCT
jgi:nucleotide sugar dehydrogenase